MVLSGYLPSARVNDERGCAYPDEGFGLPWGLVDSNATKRDRRKEAGRSLETEDDETSAVLSGLRANALQKALLYAREGRDLIASH